LWKKFLMLSLSLLMMFSFAMSIPSTASACSYDFTNQESNVYMYWYHMNTGSGSMTYSLTNHERFDTFPIGGVPNQFVTKHEIYLHYTVNSSYPTGAVVSNSYNDGELSLSTNFNSDYTFFASKGECTYISPPGSSLYGANTIQVQSEGFNTDLDVTVGAIVHVNHGWLAAGSDHYYMQIQ
jgi:hypothetical protein